MLPELRMLRSRFVVLAVVTALLVDKASHPLLADVLHSPHDLKACADEDTAQLRLQNAAQATQIAAQATQIAAQATQIAALQAKAATLASQLAMAKSEAQQHKVDAVASKQEATRLAAQAT